MQQIFKLKNRGVLGVEGTDAKDFLQGCITQDITKLNDSKLLYAAHLSPQGKFLYDFFISNDEDYILIDCAQYELMPLAKSLHSYAVGMDVAFHDMTEDYNLYASFSHFDQSFKDPRHEEMGYRALTKTFIEHTADEVAYNEKRLELCIPDGSIDALKGKTLPAELGLEFLNGVSFEKGCYVGQELTARMHHRTEAKKKIYKISLNEQLDVGTPIMIGEQEAGWIFSNDGKTGIALIKERYANKLDHIQKPIWR